MTAFQARKGRKPEIAQQRLVETLVTNLRERECLIQVVCGPRQVGKTTAIAQLREKIKMPVKYFSADDKISAGPSWLDEIWLEASQSRSILIVDEIQKVPNWSEIIKKNWDRANFDSMPMKVVLLGSSSLQIHEGLSESLTGRFELHHLYQWSWPDSVTILSLSLEDYLKFGGYPGSYRFIKNPERWRSFVRSSIVNTVIEKDLVASSRIRSPALFRQSFEVFCSYPAQEISYNKLLGQLQDKGNIDIVKHYLSIFEQAFLLKSVFKFSSRPLTTKSSSPKIIVLCPALVHFESESSETGRVFESVVGADLIRNFDRVFYWREGRFEVDYVVQDGRELYAIEVKSSPEKSGRGLFEFQKQFPKAKVKLVNHENYQDFAMDPRAWVRRR